MGGGTIIIMVLFVGLALFVILLLLLLIQTQAQAQKEAKNAAAAEQKVEQLEKTLQEVLGKRFSGEQIEALFRATKLKQQKEEAEAKAQQNAQAMAQAQAAAAAANANAAVAAKAAAEAQKALAECQKEGILISTNYRLWLFKDGRVDITDTEAKDGYWNIRYECRKVNKKEKVVKKGKGVNVENHVLGK